MMIYKALISDNGDVLNIAVFGDEEIDGNWIEYTAANPAYIGGTYENGFFYSPQPFASWVKNTETHNWEAPTPYPNDSKPYRWNEEIKEWVEIILPQ